MSKKLGQGGGASPIHSGGTAPPQHAELTNKQAGMLLACAVIGFLIATLCAVSCYWCGKTKRPKMRQHLPFSRNTFPTYIIPGHSQLYFANEITGSQSTGRNGFRTPPPAYETIVPCDMMIDYDFAVNRPRDDTITSSIIAMGPDDLRRIFIEYQQNIEGLNKVFCEKGICQKGQPPETTTEEPDEQTRNNQDQRDPES